LGKRGEGEPAMMLLFQRIYPCSESTENSDWLRDLKRQSIKINESTGGLQHKYFGRFQDVGENVRVLSGLRFINFKVK
jgi:hypothetical protein